MKTFIIFASLVYIIFNAETGNIEKTSSSAKIIGRTIYVDNGALYETSLQVGTTTQYVQGVEIETNDMKVIVGGTKNTNELTDIIIVTLQSQKPAELKTVENNFLLICSNFTGNVTQKLSFLEVQTKLTALKKVDRTAYEDIRDNLIWVDAYGKKLDKDWWDSCEWHPEIVQ